MSESSGLLIAGEYHLDSCNCRICLANRIWWDSVQSSCDELEGSFSEDFSSVDTDDSLTGITGSNQSVSLYDPALILDLSVDKYAELCCSPRFSEEES